MKYVSTKWLNIEWIRKFKRMPMSRSAHCTNGLLIIIRNSFLQESHIQLTYCCLTRRDVLLNNIVLHDKHDTIWYSIATYIKRLKCMHRITIIASMLPWSYRVSCIRTLLHLLSAQISLFKLVSSYLLYFKSRRNKFTESVLQRERSWIFQESVTCRVRTNYNQCVISMRDCCLRAFTFQRSIAWSKFDVATSLLRW